MNTQDERAAFEKWYPTSVFEHGEGADTGMDEQIKEDAWVVWQARAVLPVSQNPIGWRELPDGTVIYPNRGMAYALYGHDIEPLYSAPKESP